MTVAILAAKDSSLAAHVAARLGAECRVLELEGARVSIRGESVSWGGVALDECEALALEKPLIPWPQPIAAAAPGELESVVQRRAIAQRERSALHISAVRIAALGRPVANEPTRAADLALSSALALERLARAGVALREWRVGVAREARGGTRWALNAEHGLRPAAEECALEVDAPISETARHLALGGTWLAACPGGAAEPSALRFEASAQERELTLRALEALGLVFACVHVCRGAVAAVDAAVDLRAWEHNSENRVSAALADWLARAARGHLRPCTTP